jgi:hypothetical protein
VKPMIRRLRLLEQACEVSIYVEREDSPAAIVRARRLKRLKMEGGVVPEPKPPILYRPGMTVADILKQGRRRSRLAATEGSPVKLALRIQRLESRLPKVQKRVILVWISPDGRTIKAADTHPHLSDDGKYTRYLTPYQPGVIDATQTY